jgi:hypothetical protein
LHAASFKRQGCRPIVLIIFRHGVVHMHSGILGAEARLIQSKFSRLRYRFLYGYRGNPFQVFCQKYWFDIETGMKNPEKVIGLIVAASLP